MKLVKLFSLISILVSALVLVPAQSAELKIYCHSANPLKQKTAQLDPVQGKNVDLLFPIASVSKVMTAHWAVAKLGVKHRYITQFHLRKDEDGSQSLHIAGSRDPYTDQVFFQFVVAQLNELGITQFKEISFDENFKFRRDLKEGAAKKYMENFEPGPKTVQFQLKQMITALNADYEYTRVKAAAYYGMDLRKKLNLTAKIVEHKTSKEFEQVRKYYTDLHQHKSVPLIRNLKEMNRNSNNHAATQIFESLGGAAVYKKFISQFLTVPEDQVEKQIQFFNGSGNRLDLAPNKSVYNKATCRTMLKVQQGLRESLKAQGSGIERVMSVAGRFIEGEDPGFIEFYAGPKTEGVLVAKTGTVGPAVSISGHVVTRAGPHYFGFIAATKLSEVDWNHGRELIKTEIDQMMEGLDTGNPYDYVPLQFVPFDRESLFVNLPSSGKQNKSCKGDCK